MIIPNQDFVRTYQFKVYILTRQHLKIGRMKYLFKCTNLEEEAAGGRPRRREVDGVKVVSIADENKRVQKSDEIARNVSKLGLS